MPEITSTSSADVQKDFGFFQDEALKYPVFISKNGQPKTVLLSYEEFTRLKAQDRRTYDLDDLPLDLAADILNARVPPDRRD